VLVSALFLNVLGCASKKPAPTMATPAADMTNAPPGLEWSEIYNSQVRDRLQPIWLELMKPEVQKKMAAGTTMNTLSNFDATVEADFEILPTGAIGPVKLTKKSTYKSFNRIALKAIQQSSPLPPPPSACFQDNHCQLHWKFILSP
jgi:TonB family protein